MNFILLKQLALLRPNPLRWSFHSALNLVELNCPATGPRLRINDWGYAGAPVSFKERHMKDLWIVQQLLDELEIEEDEAEFSRMINIAQRILDRIIEEI